MTQPMGRRAALALLALGGAAIGGVGAMLGYVLPARPSRAALTLTPDRLPAPGGVTFVDDGKYQGKVAVVVNLGRDGYVAFILKCTHLGCRVGWRPNGPPVDGNREYFECPCHQARFALDGDRLYGPAPRNLDRYESGFDDVGAFVINTSAVIRGTIGQGVFFPAGE